MKELHNIYKDAGQGFIDDLLSDYVIVTEKLSGSSFATEQTKDRLQFFKGTSQKPINLVDRTIMVYYEPAIQHIKNILASSKIELPNNWRFCFQYFVHNEPGIISYTKLPENNLVLTHIHIRGETGKTAKVIDDPRVIKDWAANLTVTALQPFYSGNLTPEQKSKIEEFIRIPTEDQEELFGTASFAEYILQVLNPNTTSTTLHGNLSNPIDSLIFKFITAGSGKSFSARMIDPYTKFLMKEKVPVDMRRAPADMNEIILLDLLAFIEERGITKSDTLTGNGEERYIQLVSLLFNEYVAQRGDSLEGIAFNKADFASAPEFDLNTDLISNEKTKKLVSSSESLKDLYKVMLGSLRKKRDPKKTGAILTPSVIEDFNKMVDKFNSISTSKDDGKFKTFEDYLKLKKVNETVEEDPVKSISEEKVLTFKDFQALDIVDLSAVSEALTVPYKERGKKKVNMIVGRFQPFTLGHVKVFEQLHKQNGLPVVVFTVRGKKPNPEKSPFSEDEQNVMFNKMKKQYPFLEAMYTVPNAAIDTLYATLRPAYEPMLWGFGTDRKKAYEGMISKPEYRKDLDVEPEFKGYEIKRGDDDVSASKVRTAIELDDESTFKKMTPKSIHDMYSILQNVLTPEMTESEELITEASERKYMYLAQSNKKEDKDALYDLINVSLFKGKAPYDGRLKLNSFNTSDIKKVEKYLKGDQNAADILVKLGADVTGIGRGEIMLAYIIENCSIGGGSQDIDLTLYNDKHAVSDQAELKEAQLSIDGWLYNWRTGAKHRSIIQHTLANLKLLYDGLKDVLPELDISTKLGSEIAALTGRQEFGKFVKEVRSIDPVEIHTALAFNIEESPTNKLMISNSSGEILGDLTDAKTLSKIKTILSTGSTLTLKSFNAIEKELVAGFGKVNEKFIFVQTNRRKRFMGIHYKDAISGSLDQTQFYAATAGTVKVKVKA